MQHLQVSGAVRPLKWPLGVKWLMYNSYHIELYRKELYSITRTKHNCPSTQCIFNRDTLASDHKQEKVDMVLIIRPNKTYRFSTVVAYYTSQQVSAAQITLYQNFTFCLLPTCTHLGHQHRMTVTRYCIDTICLS